MTYKEDKMTIIITMAGLGSRFKDAGYDLPKYMIDAKGKTLFEWSMDSLSDYKKHTEKIIFVVRKEDNAEAFISDMCEKSDIREYDIIEINELTDGQATTCMLALSHCDYSTPILIYNIDTYIEPNELKYNALKGDGHIPCFNAPGDHWSFVKVDDNGKVEEVKEKVRISDNCSLGAYYFSSAKLFKELYEEYYKDNENLEKNEKYIAPLYNYMLEKNMSVTMSIVDEKKVHVLGTPEELKIFLNN